MPVTINTNTAATLAATNLNTNNSMLQKSLARLSSGSKITTPADDAAGLAVSMRMQAAIKRSDATNVGLSNALSFLQVQDGAMKSTGKVLERISELKLLSTDVTKNAGDIANYDAEFTALKAELSAQGAAKFNGVDLFATGGATLNVVTSEDASQSMTLSKADFSGMTSTITAAANLAALSVTNISDAITEVATARAQNGAESSRLNFAIDLNTTNRLNLEAANSRIVDVDVAEESTRLAKNNILVQAGTAMLSQANSSAQSALKLLQG